MHNNSLFHQLFDFILERSFEEPAKSLSGDRYCKFSNSRSIPGPVYGGLNDPNDPSKSRAQNSKKKTLNSEKENKVKKKKSRHRTTLPHSVVQYHRREASYRSCSGWEREFQACYRHREKIYKKEGRKAGRRGMLQIQRLLLIC